ncbi:filament polymerization regulator ParJ [Neomicrococcus aestuarii]
MGDVADHSETNNDFISWVAQRGTDSSVRPAVMLVAFEGWNDAGEAASDAVRAFADAWGAQLIAQLPADDYYDYQFSRPTVRRNVEGKRVVSWPTTHVYRSEIPDHQIDAVFVRGVEPTYRWQAFTAHVLGIAQEQNVQAIIFVGALLADVPHSRPIPTTLSSEEPHLRDMLDAQEATYEGPTGIIGVMSETATESSIPGISLWAAVPHYVGQSPSPKASLGLVKQIEHILHVTIDETELREFAEAWERGVDELAREDAEVAAYVKQLEEQQDATELPEASGESIAREFEQYLKRRDKNRRDNWGDAGSGEPLS